MKYQKGFTIFEMLLVISITTAIAAAGIIGLSELQAIFKIRSASDEIRALLQLGRELAIANKNQVDYTIQFSSNVAVLCAGQAEIARYISPEGIIYSPNSFTWGFTPKSGELTGCPLPCNLSLTSTNNTELITIQTNGIVN